MSNSENVSGELRRLLDDMDEAELRAFGMAILDDPDSQTTLFSVYHAIYARTKADGDLDMAIRAGEQLLPAPSNAGEAWAGRAEEASTLFRARFERGLVAEDLEQSISWIQEAITVTPEDSTHFARRMAYLENLLNIKDNIPSDTEDDGQANLLLKLHQVIIPAPGTDDGFDQVSISFARTTIADPSISLNQRLFLSSSLRNVLEKRFMKSGLREDVDGAIEAAEMAVSAASQLRAPCHIQETVLAEANFDLGMLLVERLLLSHSQDLTEISYAIVRLEQASKGVKDPKRRGLCFNGLSGLLADRNRITGQTVDMERAVQTAMESLRFVPINDTHFRPGRLFNYGSKLRALYEITNRDGLLDQALSQVSAALQLLPEPKDMQRWARYKTEYAAILLRKYTVSGDIGHLNKGIECCDEISANGHAAYLSGNYGEYWNILAGLLRNRYDRLEVREDIDRAVEAAGDAVASLPKGHKEYGGRLGNLSHMYWRRFSRLGDPTDIEVAIEKAKAAVSATNNNSNMVIHLTTLSGLLSARYELTGDDADMSQSVSCAKQAAENTAKERIDYLINRSPSLEDMTKAVDILRSVIIESPIEEPDRASRSSSLSVMLLARYHITYSAQDLKEAIDLLDQCSKHPNAPPSLQISAAERAADLLISQSRLKEADALLRRAVADLRKVSPRSLQQKDQEHMIKKFAGLATLATSIALEVGAEAEDAVQIMEEGRGIILSLLFEVRSDLEGLRVKHPDLAADFERLRAELDAPAAYGDSGATAIQSSITLTRREQVAKEFDEKVEAIRKDTEFQDFLKPAQVAKLKSAASAGTIIIINVSRLRTDAFILEADQDIDSLPLQNLPLSKIQDWVLLLQSRKMTQLQMFKLLEWLWDNLASPILDRLEKALTATRQKGEMHHVWWVPTGPLCSLPIHAAGRYTQGSMTPVSLLNKVVSSYSPSVKAMLFTQQNKVALNQMGSPKKALLVAMGRTLGHKSLPYAKKEVNVVGNKLTLSKTDSESPTILHEPSKSDVLEKLLTAQILHFAGHGKSDPADPLQSALYLQDWKEDLLTVRDLMSLKLHRNPPFLAYLSACSTGSNKVDGLIDEGLHLMSACQLVGFQHVIGSLWEVSDRHCVDVARAVFAKIVDSGMSDTSVSFGLQEGVRSLRDRGRPGFRITRDDRGDKSDISEDESDISKDGSDFSEDESDTREDEAAAGIHRDAFTPAGVEGPWTGGDPRVWAAYIHIGR